MLIFSICSFTTTIFPSVLEHVKTATLKSLAANFNIEAILRLFLLILKILHYGLYFLFILNLYLTHLGTCDWTWKYVGIWIKLLSTLTGVSFVLPCRTNYWWILFVLWGLVSFLVKMGPLQLELCSRYGFHAKKWPFWDISRMTEVLSKVSLDLFLASHDLCYCWEALSPTARGCH